MTSRMKIIAPLSCGAGALRGLKSASYDIGNNTVVIKTPDQFKNAPTSSILKCYPYYRDVPYCLIHTYECPAERANLVNTENLNQEAFDAIRFANLALWLAKPNPASFDLLYHAEVVGNGWECRGWRHVPELSSNQQHWNAKLTNTDLETAKSRNEVLHKIRGDRPDSPVWFASRACYKALTESWWEARFLWFWISLEALFCPGKERKISRKLKDRLAAFLDIYGEQQKALDNSYEWRSRVAHGKGLSDLNQTGTESIDLLAGAESHLQMSLGKILADRKLSEKFSNDSKREKYLKELVPTAATRE